MKATRRIRLGRWILAVLVVGVLVAGPTASFGDIGGDEPNPGPITTYGSSFALSPMGAVVHGGFLVLDALY